MAGVRPDDDSSPDREGPTTAPRDVDLICQGEHVVTMDADRRIIGDGAVAIDGGRIVDVGTADDIRNRYRTAATLGGRRTLIIPGLINAHQHLTGDRLIRSAIPDDIPSDAAIFDWAVPVHAAHTPDDDELSATLSLAEAASNGITFTVEAGTVAHPERVLAAYEAVGVGGTLGSWGWDVGDGPYAGSVADVLDRQRDVLRLTAAHGLVDGWVTLVGHDLMSDDLVVAASELARSSDTRLTFHLSPSAADGLAYLDRTGRRPLVHLDQLGALGRHVLIAHGVHLDDVEVEVLLANDAAVAYCPWAYLRLAQGVTGAGRHAEIIGRGGRVALGCDSENAGDAVDILRAAALAAGLAKDMAVDPTRLGAHGALALATIDGAHAIGMAHELGSLERGKRADVVLIDRSAPAWIPRSPDPVLQLIWASDGRAVRDVVAGGRVVVRDRHLTTVDLDALRPAAEARSAALMRR